VTPRRSQNGTDRAGLPSDWHEQQLPSAGEEVELHDLCLQRRHDAARDDTGTIQVGVRRQHGRLQTCPGAVGTQLLHDSRRGQPLHDRLLQAADTQPHAMGVQLVMQVEHRFTCRVVHLGRVVEREDDHERSRLAPADPLDDGIDQRSGVVTVDGRCRFQAHELAAYRIVLAVSIPTPPEEAANPFPVLASGGIAHLTGVRRRLLGGVVGG